MGILDGITLSLDYKRKKAPRAAKQSGLKQSGQLVKSTEKPKTKSSVKKQIDATDFKPLDRVIYVGTQLCSRCGQTTRYIAGDLIRYWEFNKVAGLRTIRTCAYAAADRRFDKLKTSFDYLATTHCICVDCRLAEKVIDDFFAGEPMQWPLL